MTVSPRRVVWMMVGPGIAAAPGWMAATLALGVLAGLSAALYPYGFKLFVDAFVQHDAAQLRLTVALTGGLIALYWLVAILDANVGFGLSDRVSLHLSTHVAGLVNRISGIEHFERPEFLRELELIEQNGEMLAIGPRQCVTILQIAVRVGVMVALLVSVHPFVAVLPLFGLLPAIAQSQASRMAQASQERQAEPRRLADRFFTLATSPVSAKELRIYRLDDELARRHADLASRIDRDNVGAAVRGTALVLAAWVPFVAWFVAGVLLLLGRAAKGQATAGDLILAVVLAQQVRTVVAQMIVAVGQTTATVRTIRRVLWLEGESAREWSTIGSAGSVERTGPVPEVLTSGIEVRGVSFRYPGSVVDVLRDVELNLPAGCIVALVGANGAGKTTLVKLLTQLYVPTAGDILVDGVDLQSLPTDEWRARCTGTFQDFVAFELVARETVGVGDLPRIEDEVAVEHALLRAGANDVVATLGDGLETQLGRSFPGGRELSLGQWQKLALGRGMMRPDPLLVVLDEPTASLDADTEHALFTHYAEAARHSAALAGAITLLVSHRFSTVRVADVIVVLDGGRIVEVGDHDALMTQGGLYAELYGLQARGYA